MIIEGSCFYLLETVSFDLYRHFDIRLWRSDWILFIIKIFKTLSWQQAPSSTKGTSLHLSVLPPALSRQRTWAGVEESPRWSLSAGPGTEPRCRAGISSSHTACGRRDRVVFYFCHPDTDLMRPSAAFGVLTRTRAAFPTGRIPSWCPPRRGCSCRWVWARAGWSLRTRCALRRKCGPGRRWCHCPWGGRRGGEMPSLERHGSYSNCCFLPSTSW